MTQQEMIEELNDRMDELIDVTSKLVMAVQNQQKIIENAVFISSQAIDEA